MAEESIEDVYKELTKKIEEERKMLLEMSYLIRSITPSILESQGDEKLKRIVKAAKTLKLSVSKKLKLVDLMYESSITDHLTGLRSRKYFDDVLKPNLERTDNFSYLMMDLDHFGNYNDKFGHLQGDEALRRVAGVIKDKSSGDIAVRYGGEEFSVILLGYRSTAEKAHCRAEDIRNEIEDMIIMPFSDIIMTEHILKKISCEEHLQAIIKNSISRFFNDESINGSNYDARLRDYFTDLGNELCMKLGSSLQPMQRVTISIGGALRKEGESMDDVIKRADDALYKAKETRNAVVMA